MNYLRRFMLGRYGSDQLSMALILLSLLLSMIAGFTHIQLLRYIADIPLVISIFRILSRDISKRRRENYKFSMLMGPTYSWLKKAQRYALDSRTHRYYKCPNCKTQLRVPKGKGKIIITCPKCKTEFRERS